MCISERLKKSSIFFSKSSSQKKPEIDLTVMEKSLNQTTTETKENFLFSPCITYICSENAIQNCNSKLSSLKKNSPLLYDDFMDIELVC
ncbi:hypothetical protein HK099_004274 [Clydaea vesicula]|uniref:Uncharacterized protein n=1 Tax=Clydaea vesicula TaxID=447962 RepID=A0AAD5XZH0_9FUNG|nr:hypothetical protein HK099_004274 [Clydaea vesicula]